MKTRKVLVAILIFLALLSVISLITLFYLSRGPDKTNLTLGEWLAKVDADFGSGYLPRAEENLERALPYIQNEDDYLRVLKRAYRIDQYKKSGQIFSGLARRAWERFPRSQDIAFLAAASALTTENTGGVGNILSSAPRSEKLDRLRFHMALMGTGSMTPAELMLEGDLVRLAGLIDSRDPAAYLLNAEKLAEPRLVLDAALLFMARGEGEKAFQLVRDSLPEETYDEPAVLIAMDNLEWESSLRRVNRLSERYPQDAEYHALAGDVYLRISEWEQARSRYLKALNYNPEEGPALYLNLNWLYQQESHFDSAALFLDEGLVYYPSNKDLLLEKAKLLRHRQKFSEARSLLETSAVPLNGELSLLLLSLQQKTLEPARFRIQLWTIFNNNPTDAGVCRTLISVLLGAGNAEDARVALEAYMNRTGIQRSPWLLHFKGLILAENGDFRGAKELLAESLALQEDKYVRFNRGMLQLTAGDYAGAVADFLVILEPLGRDVAEDPRFYARCVTAIGEAKMNQGQLREAMKQFRYALEIDPENYHALLLLKQVERISG